MTPYLIGGVWVPLEMVLTASETVEPTQWGWSGNLTIALRNDPLCPVVLPNVGRRWFVDHAKRPEAQALWDQFLAAWKANVAARQAPTLPTPASSPSQPQPSAPAPTP